MQGKDAGCLHLSHAVRKVGWDGGETFPSTVHNVVAAGAHGRARASTDAARLQAGRVLVTCREKKKTEKENYIRAEMGRKYDENRGTRSFYRCVSTGGLGRFSVRAARLQAGLQGEIVCRGDLCADMDQLSHSCGAQTLPLLFLTSTLCALQTELQINAHSQGCFDIENKEMKHPTLDFIAKPYILENQWARN